MNTFYIYVCQHTWCSVHAKAGSDARQFCHPSGAVLLGCAPRAAETAVGHLSVARLPKVPADSALRVSGLSLSVKGV